MVKKIHAFSILFVFAASTLLNAASGDLDAGFITNLGAGITGINYPSHSPTGAVNAVGLQSGGKILIGGNRSLFNNTGEQTALKRLNADGTLDEDFGPSTAYTNGPHVLNVSFSSEINAILVNSDGSFYIGGVFDSYGEPAVTRTAVARVNEDGTLDATFNPPAFGGSARYVMSLALDDNGGLLVGGAFTVSGKRNLLRMDATTGAIDTTFTATGGAGDVNATVDCVSLGTDGRIYVSGANNQGRPLVHRLFANGSRDVSFQVPFANDFGRVNKVLALPDGRVVIGGGHTLLGRPAGDFINGLTSNGALDTAFQANLGTGSTGWTGGVLKLTPDGRILAGGIFTSFNGTPVASLVLLAQDGTRDETFTPVPYTTAQNGYLTHFYSAAVQPDGMIVAGGWLDHVSDPELDLRNLVRFNGDSETAGAATLKMAAPLGVATVESAGSVKVQVVRLPGLSGEATVDYTTSGGTAVAGTHYTATSGTLSWEDGEGGVKEISIPLTNNATTGGNKTFNVTLSDATGADLGEPDVTQVTILDDEALAVITSPPANVTTNQGNSFTLSVGFSSVSPASLQWQFDPGTGFADIPGEMATTYTVPLSNPLSHNGTYRVIVTNGGGPLPSAPATVTVLTPAGSLAAGFVSAVTNGTISHARPDGSGGTIVISTSGFPSNLTMVQRLTSTGSIDPAFVQSSIGGGLGGSPTGFVVLPDGRFVVSGYFGTVTSPSTGSPVSRIILARFNANGSFDSAYSPALPPNAGTSVYATALAPGLNGKFYVGFNRAGMRRYNADGTLDGGFTAPVELGSDLDGEVTFVRELSNGKVLVAHRIGRNGQGFTYNIWRLNIDGTRDLGFVTPGANQDIRVIEVLPDGRVAIGGQFTTFSTIPGVPMERVALLDANGAVDLSFRSPVPNNIIYQIVHKNGRLLIGGTFTGFNNPALTQGGIARLNLDGSVDSSFVVGPGANNAVNAIFLVGNDHIFAAGGFTQFNGQNVNRAVMLIDPPALGSVGFMPPRITVIEAATQITLTAQRFGPTTEAISIDWTTEEIASGTATAGADFTAANGTLTWAAGDAADKTIQITLLDDNDVESTETFRVALGNTNGPVTAAASATITILDSNTPVTFTTQPTGTSLVAGSTLNLTAAVSSPTPVSLQWFLNGLPVAGATSANLSLTNITTVGAGLYVLHATNAAGTFLSNTAQVVITQNPNAIVGGWPLNLTINAAVRAIVTTPDGGAYIGGDFTNFNGTGRNYLVKLSASGVLDTTFNPAPDSAITKIALSGDGKLFVLGNITQIGGGAAINNQFGAIDSATGARLGAFMTALGTGAENFKQIRCLTMLSDGDLLLGGDFTFFNGSSNHKYLARLNSDGTLDGGFNTSTATGTVALVVTAVGATPTGGGFFAAGSIGLSGGSRWIKLNADGSRDATFAPAMSGSSTFSRIRALADGRVMATGGNLPGGNRTITRVSAAGAWDSAEYFGQTSGSFTDFVFQPNGRTIGVGSTSFVRAQGGTVNNIASFNLTGNYDNTWATGSGFNAVANVAELGLNGEIWIGGDFTTYHGVTVPRLLRIAGNPGDPAIVNPPVTIGVNGGATAQFSVGAVGTNLAYQWLKNGVELTDVDNISGATSSILTIANVTQDDDDFYSVEVTGGTPENTVSSAEVKLNVLGAPIVVTSPDSVTPALGSTITLAADVLAATQATYVWRRNGVLIQNGGRYSGADTATLVIANGNSADDGDYILTVTNTLGTDASTAATVAVNQTAHARDTTLSALSATSAGNSNNNVNAFLHLPDGRTLLAGTGNFRGVDNAQVGGLSVISTAGNLSVLPAGAFSGEVRALHLLANGKVLVAGNFTQVGAVARNRIARLNADLTLDTSFNPAGTGAANTINLMTVDTAGRIYLYGTFFSYDGINGYSNYVRLLTDGTLDLEYKVSFTGGVSAMVALPDGKMLIGGGIGSHTFNDVTTNNLNSLCRLLPTGAIDPAFTNGLPAGYAVNTFTLDSMGRIVVGANSFSGQAFYHLIRLLSGGGLDPAFTLPDTINGEIRVLKALGNNQVLVGGRFTAPTNRLFLVNADGTRDTTFNVGTGFTHTSGSPIVTALSQDTLGRIWVGGTVFTSYNSATANAIAVLQGQGTALAFLSHPSGQTLDLGTTATFTTAVTANNGFTFQWRKGNVALVDGGRISGATSATLTISDLALSDAAAYSVVVTTPGDSITSAEAMLTILSAPVILDNPVSLTRDVGGTAVFSGRAKGAATLLYQWFLFDTALVDGTGIAGATTPTLTLTGVDFADAGNYRLRVSNHLDTEFTTIANLRVEKKPGAFSPDVGVTSAGTVYALLKLTDGSILVGGSFGNLTINGSVINRGRIARFLANGTLDPNFTPVFNNGEVRALAKDDDGNIFVGGTFLSVTFGSTTTNVMRVAKLKPDLTLDAAFAVGAVAGGPNNTVNAMAADEAGGVYAGGTFTKIGTFDINYMARLNQDGGRVTSFSSPLAVNQTVNGLLRRPDGQVYIGSAGNLPQGGTGNMLCNANGGKVSAFAAAPGGLVLGEKFLLLADGSLLMSGNGGNPQGYLRRLNANTGVEIANYSSLIANKGVGIAAQPDGKMVAGSITSFARFNLAGTADTGFFTFNNTVHSIVVDNSGRIWVGGAFNSYGSSSVTGLAVLNGGELDSRDGLLTPQNITFAEINNRTFNPAANSFTIPAVTSSSGLTVSVAVTSGLASISNNTVSITGAGQVTITATQAGDATYASASVSRTFTVAKGDQTINFPALGDRSAASGSFNLNASASSGLPVSYSWISGPATVNGSEVTLTGDVGTVTLAASQAGNDNWNPATAVQQSFEATSQPLVPVAQTITWTPPASIFQGQLPFALGATASSGLPVVYQIMSTTGGTLVNGSLTSAPNVAIKIRATQPGNSGFLAATFVEKTITVKANPTALTLINLSQVYTGTGRAASVLPTTAGTFYYTINKVKGTTLPVNVGSYPVEFVSAVGGAKKTGSLVITKAPLRVIPDSQRRFVGQDNPVPLTFGYDGFLGSDTSASAVSKAPVVTTTATKTSPGGNYPIKPAGGTSVNYAFVYVNATMKVETWAGQYEALVEATGSGLPAGKLEITVLANSIGFTGKLTSSKNAAVAFKGNLTRDLLTEHATATVNGVVGTGATAVTYGLEVDLPLMGDFEAELTRKVGAGVAAPFGETTIGQKIFLGTGKPPVPYAGAHTMIITKPVHLTGSVLPLPGGSSRATAVIDVKGKMTLAGVLADGTKITASLFPDHQAGYRLYALPYAAGRLDSYAAAWLDLMPHPDLAGRGYIPEQTQAFYWAKSANSKDLNYRGGFPETNGSITLDPWMPPVTKPAIINLRQRLGLNGTGEMDVLDDLPGTLTLTGLPDAVTMDAAGKVIVPTTTPNNPRAWKVTITPATGLFVGSHTVLDGTKSLTVNFSGVMRQPSSTDPSPEFIGAGFGLVPQLTGQDAGTTSTSISFERPAAPPD